jgi:hypothetical protein
MVVIFLKGGVFDRANRSSFVGVRVLTTQLLNPKFEVVDLSPSSCKDNTRGAKRERNIECLRVVKPTYT